MDLKIAEPLTQSGDLELREDYSGRGMHGDTTAAIVCDSFADLACAAVCLATELTREQTEDDYNDVEPDEDQITGEDIAEALRHLRSDNMGRQMVFY